MLCRLIILCLFFPAALSAGTVVINEFMSSNHNTLTDEDGDYEDWLELYNPGSTTVNLLNYRITDDPAQPARWIFPNVSILPGQHLLIFTSGKNRKFGPWLHTNFKIDTEGEPLLLFDPAGHLIDSVGAVAVPTDVSFGRRYDGAAEWTYFELSTPGTSNAAGIITIGPADTFDMPVSGFYPEGTDIQISFRRTDVDIFYTLDGSEPHPGSAPFTGTLLLERGMEAAPALMNIPTARKWQQPETDLPAGIIFRAAAYFQGQKVSHTCSGTYFIENGNEMMAGWPVFALITEPEDLFGDEAGIYVPGPPYEVNPNYPHYWQRGEQWEREAEIAFINEHRVSVFQQKAGLRVHGMGSRRQPQKSLRLYARNSYSQNTFDYPFFPNKPHLNSFRRLLLRTTMGDWRNVGFTDEYTAAIVRNMDLDYQEFLPVLVFINGEFWGIHHLRERVDPYFFEANNEANPDNLDLIDQWGVVSDGSSEAFFALQHWVDNAKPSSPEYFEELQQRIDPVNLADYFIAEMYLRNIDWPFHNYTTWRPEGGLWRWFYFDCDACMIRHGDKNLIHLFQDIHILPDHSDPQYYRIILKALQNEEFKTLFTQRFIDHLNNTFHPARMLPILDQMAARYKTMLPWHIRRWHFPSTQYAFEQNLTDLRDFIIRRHHLMTNDVNNIFRIRPEVSPNPVSIDNPVFRISGLPEYPRLKTLVEVINMQGVLLYHQINVGIPAEVKLPGIWAAGIYILRLTDGVSVYHTTFMIMP